MMPAPFLHAASTPAPPAVQLAVLPAVAWAYLAGVRRLRARGRRWSPWRTFAFLAGVAVVGASLTALPGFVAPAGFAEHAVEHVLLGMFGPALLALSAPTTLLLAHLPRQQARWLAAAMRRRPFAVIAHPVTTALLSVGGMFVLYLTPLFAATLSNPLLHSAVHLHLFAAGYLFAWSIAGADPAPRRASFGLRLTALVAAAAVHAGLVKVMYAHGLPAGTAHSAAEIREGLQWMYYGGDLAEVLLAAALFASWYKRRGPATRGRPGRTPVKAVAVRVR